jgi:O-antigen/teichoic acid export membrane protein
VSDAVETPGGFARAFTSLSLASVVSMGANLVRGKLAALFLGPAGVGVFNQLSLMWNLFQTAGSLGSFNGLVQHGTEAMVAEDEAALHRLASTWWILLTGFSCFLAAIGALASHMISNWLLSDHGAHANLVALMLIGIPFAVSSQVYRSLLAAARLVPQLVRAQVISDVGGAIVFASLIPVLGLPGAIIGFSTIHLIFYLVTALSVRQKLGGGYVRPRLGEFRWDVVRSNIGFGASGLAMVALSNLSVLIVSRMVIDQLGIGANGIFSNAWRIASVYLGAVTTTAISYYLPTLTRAESDGQMSRDVNAALRFYLYVLPPVMALLMAAGELIVRLILSAKFLPVAPLLLLFVPAELMRVLAETVGMPLVARRRLWAVTLLSILQTLVFIAGAALALSPFGLIGAATAYGIATTSAGMAILATCYVRFRLTLDGATWIALARGILLLAAIAVAGFALSFGPERGVVDAGAILFWLAWVWRDKGTKDVIGRLGAKKE